MTGKITNNSEIIELNPKILSDIEKKGYIKSLRKSDTGVGYTLETVMGIKENNLANCDFTFEGKPIELKAQRIIKPEQDSLNDLENR